MNLNWLGCLHRTKRELQIVDTGPQHDFRLVATTLDQCLVSYQKCAYSRILKLCEHEVGQNVGTDCQCDVVNDVS